jgi:hypothetical protein
VGLAQQPRIDVQTQIEIGVETVDTRRNWEGGQEIWRRGWQTGTWRRIAGQGSH